MYNGIGLQTARGSGTNGYVQRNLSFVRIAKPKVEYKTEDEIRRFESEYNKPPNQEILEHHRKRKIEVQCLELEEKLEKEGLTDDEIQKRISEYRQELIKKMEKSLQNRNEFILEFLNERSMKETHQMAEMSKDRNDKLKSALGISANFVEGSSMDIIRQAKEQQSAREETICANKDLIVASLNAESTETQSTKIQPTKRSKKRRASTSSESSSDSSSSSSNSSESEESSSSSSSSSSSGSSNSGRDLRKVRYSKDKRNTKSKKESSRKPRDYSKTRYSIKNEQDLTRKRTSHSSKERKSRNDSLPRKYSRYSDDSESDSPPKRQLQSVVLSKHKQSTRYRSRSKSYEKERSSRFNVASTSGRSPSPGANRSSRSRSNSYVPSRRRSTSVSSNNQRNNDRRSGKLHSKRRRSRSRSTSLRYRQDKTRKRSGSRDRYSRTKNDRRRSLSSSVSRSPSKSPSPKSDRLKKSRSPSIPRRRGSPSFLDKRRITRY